MESTRILNVNHEIKIVQKHIEQDCPELNYRNKRP